MKRPKYGNPPVVEAVCHFLFEPNEDWGLARIAALHQRLVEDYPEPPRDQNVLEARMSGDEEGKVGFSLEHRIAKTRIQFPAEQGTRIVSIGPDELAVHMLRPYAGWEEFRPRIVKALNAYIEVSKPKGVRRVGVRYINRVFLPPGMLRLEQYFTKSPEYPDDLPVSSISAFFSRIECKHSSKPIRLTITFADTEATAAEQSSVLFDIDATWPVDDASFHPDTAMHQVDDLRDCVSLTFEKYITDELRTLFNGHRDAS